MADMIEVEILDDGSVKVVTGRISGPNHGSAEMLLRELSTAMGGAVDSRRRAGHTHHHHHETQQNRR